MAKNDKGFHFFLGGADLEMTEIRKMLEAQGQPFDDANLSWGAKATDYGRRIDDVALAGKTPVLVELTLDRKLPGSVKVVDHHGEDSQKPASILQIAELLGVEPSRDQVLVAANDSGWIPGLEKAGASREEIADIRARDRAAQGISEEQEAQATKAIEEAAYKPSWGNTKAGRYQSEGTQNMAVVYLPHSKTAPVVDAYRSMHEVREDGTVIEGPKSVLMISDDGEVNFSGPGDVAADLAKYFPKNSWSGGEGLGDSKGQAFFGIRAREKEVEAVYAVAIFSHVRNGHGTRDGVPGMIMGRGPWLDHQQPDYRMNEKASDDLPELMAFFAVDIAKASGSAAPVKIFADTGGGFTDYRLSQAWDDDAWGRAKKIGLEGEAMKVVRETSVARRAKAKSEREAAKKAEEDAEKARYDALKKDVERRYGIAPSDAR